MSVLAREAAEVVDGVRRQICVPAFAELARRLSAKPPDLVVTCARGSSDHAATYGKYLIETRVGRLVASVGPSVASSYARSPQGLEHALFIAVSQSGRSPDVLELTQAARDRGALVVAIVNDEASPLSALADLVIPLCAGEELAVAATKSFLLSCFAFLQLVAAWTHHADLVDAVALAPDAFDAPTPYPLELGAATSTYVLGRGLSLGPAAELALKLKETCGIHAEAFSTAEIMHGPIALVTPGFPIVALGQRDETETGVREVLSHLATLGASIFPLIDTTPTLPPTLAPLRQVQSCYLALPTLAAARGLDADAPRNLKKVTKTR